MNVLVALSNNVRVIVHTVNDGAVTLLLFLLRLLMLFCLLWLLHAGSSKNDRQSRIRNMNSFTSNGERETNETSLNFVIAEGMQEPTLMYDYIITNFKC